MKSFEQYKTEFYHNSAVNPYTGRTIQKGKGKYNELVKQFGDPTSIIQLNVNQTEINPDILYNIILYSNIKDIKSLCSINQTAVHLCHQNRWQEKFKMDQLPSFENIYTIDEYLKMKKIDHEVRIIVKYAQWRGFKALINTKDQPIDKILPDFVESDIMLLYTFFDRGVYINYNKQMKFLSWDEFYTLLMKLFYYIPDIDIRRYMNDKHSISYRIQYLKQDLNKRGFKGHAQFRLKEYKDIEKDF
ncbi:MAG TPA: hypothetical protein VLG50_05255 [Candidatus Saccharimonadales bacterium]|nr:hypothetical protein [Candidatus Saccharimonadales bacterium]